MFRDSFVISVCATGGFFNYFVNNFKLNQIDAGFWGGDSKVKLKIIKDNTEALISLNKDFKIDLSSENLDNLRGIFGDNNIKLS